MAVDAKVFEVNEVAGLGVAAGLTALADAWCPVCARVCKEFSCRLYKEYDT